MAKYAAAIDQGTTSTRCMIFDHGGQVVCVAQKEHEQIYPEARAGSSTTPNEIWARTQEVDRRGDGSPPARAPDDIAGVGITNQRETAVVWDRTTGEPIHNALVWQDTRTDKLVDEYSRDGGQARFQEKVGLPLATYFSGPKIRWILDNVDGAAERAESGDLLFGNMDTWLIWNLTGGTDGGLHITDVTNASRTMLMDLKTPRLGRRDPGRHGHPARRCCRRSRRPARSTARCRRRRAGGRADRRRSSATSRRRRSARRASRPARRRTPTARATSCCSTPAPRRSQSKNGLLTTVGYKIGDEDAVYCLEGVDRDHRRARAVAARQPEDDQGRARGRGARADGRGQRRLLHRAGVLRPVRAVLEVQRPRRHRGPDALRQRRATSPARRWRRPPSRAARSSRR